MINIIYFQIIVNVFYWKISTAFPKDTSSTDLLLNLATFPPCKASNRITIFKQTNIITVQASVCVS